MISGLPAGLGRRVATVVITRFREVRDPRGERIATTWRAIIGAAQDPRSASSKRALPLWSPATFHGNYRSADRVEAVYALGYDDDVAWHSWPAARASWSELRVRGLLHSTASHTPAAPRYRAVLLLARPVSGGEYRILWAAIARRLADLDHAVGREASDPSRAWYVPARVGDGQYLVAELEGEPLDVDGVLAVEARRADTRRRAPVAPVACSSRYGAAALARAAASVRAAVEGERNVSLNAAAFGLGQLVAAGLLERKSVEAVLTAAAATAGLDRLSRGTQFSPPVGIEISPPLWPEG